MTKLKKMIAVWNKRGERKELTDIEAISDSGPLSNFWDAEEPPKVLRLLDLKKGDTVLDAGCGSGRYLNRFSDLKAFVVGVDVSIPMLKRAKEKSARKENVFLVRGDISNLPFKAASFNAVVSIAVLQHLPPKKYFVVNEEPCKKAVKEFVRVLKPGGNVVVSFANLFHASSIENILSSWFIYKLLKRENVMYYTTIGKAKKWFEDCSLKVVRVIARCFYPPFRIQQVYIVPRRFIFQYLMSFEPIASFVNKRAQVLKPFGHSFLIKGRPQLEQKE